MHQPLVCKYIRLHLHNVPDIALFNLYLYLLVSFAIVLIFSQNVIPYEMELAGKVVLKVQIATHQDFPCSICSLSLVL